MPPKGLKVDGVRYLNSDGRATIGRYCDDVKEIIKVCEENKVESPYMGESGDIVMKDGIMGQRVEIKKEYEDRARFIRDHNIGISTEFFSTVNDAPGVPVCCATCGAVCEYRCDLPGCGTGKWQPVVVPTSVIKEIKQWVDQPEWCSEDIKVVRNPVFWMIATAVVAGLALFLARSC